MPILLIGGVIYLNVPQVPAPPSPSIPSNGESDTKRRSVCESPGVPEEKFSRVLHRHFRRKCEDVVTSRARACGHAHASSRRSERIWNAAGRERSSTHPGAATWWALRETQGPCISPPCQEGMCVSDLPPRGDTVEPANLGDVTSAARRKRRKGKIHDLNNSTRPTIDIV